MSDLLMEMSPSEFNGDLFAATNVAVDGTVVAKGVMFAMAFDEYSDSGFCCWPGPWSSKSIPMSLENAGKVLAYQGIGDQD